MELFCVNRQLSSAVIPHSCDGDFQNYGEEHHSNTDGVCLPAQSNGIKECLRTSY